MHKNKKIDFMKAYHSLEKNLGEIGFVKKRKKRKKIIFLLKFFTYLMFTILVVLFVFGFYAFLNIKSVYSEAMKGKDYINQSLGLIKEGEFSQADVYARKAGANFKNIEESLGGWQNNFFIERSPFLNDQIGELNALSESAFVLSKSLAKITNVGVDLEKILDKDEDLKFSQFSEEEKEAVLKLIYESRPQFTGLRANISLAYLKLDKIKFSRFLFSVQERVDQIKDKLKKMEELSGQMINLFYLTPKLAGYPEQSNFLVLFQNSNELRPTGGFLGTYGILKVKNGEIVKFDTHDIYHMDMPVEGVLKVEPPEEIKKYLNDKWYMRDANWSPDWPTSAKKIEWFYHEEDKLLPKKNRINDFEGDFDGIIGVTPELVTDLLSLVGPVYIDGDVYNKDNFLDLLQYEVQRGYEGKKPSWERKEVVGEILAEIKTKFFDLPFDDWQRIKLIFDENVGKNNFLMYLNNNYYQGLVNNLNWTGEVKNVDSDYLMVVDSNMGALKTDSVIDRGIDYELEEGLGGLFVNLKIKYSHSGKLSWKISKYRDYNRIFIPEGSEFISVQGENIYLPNQDKVDIKSDLGKISIGTYFELEPGEIGYLHYKYKLPDYLENQVKSGKYEIYMQRQPGSQISSLKVDISLLDKIKSYNPVSFYSHIGNEEKELEWDTDFYQNRIFQIRTK